jgi:hypothetical protein
MDKSEGQIYLWNKSHLNVFSANEDLLLLDHEYSFNLYGTPPRAFLEYIAETASLPHDEIIADSHTIYAYFHNRYFKVNSVKPGISDNLLDVLLSKTKSEQLLLIDCDDENTITLYQYSRTEGKRKSRGPLVQQGEGYSAQNFSPIRIEDLTIDKISRFVENSAVIDETLDTAWLFTGELVSYLNTNIGHFLLEFYREFQGDLPLRNTVYLDKYNLLNYELLLGTDYFRANFGGSFYKYPLTIFRLALLPSESNIEMNMVDGSTRKVNPKFSKGMPIFSTRQSGHLFKYANLTFTPGEVWFWSPSKGGNAKSQFLPYAELENKPLKSYSYPELFCDLHKKSKWEIPVSRVIYNSAEVGKPLEFSKRQRFVTEKRESFVYMPHVKKNDLLVINGQKVVKTEPLNKVRNIKLVMQTKQHEANSTGKISTQYFADHSFIAIENSADFKRDLGWLKDDAWKVAHKLKNQRLGISIGSSIVPLQDSLGVSFFGNMIFVHDFAEVDEYGSEVIGLLLVCKHELSVDQLQSLYDKGVKAVVCPNVNGVDKLPRQYWQIFSLGIISDKCKQIPDYMVKSLLRLQSSECYLDVHSLELKIRYVNNAKGVFISPKDKRPEVIGNDAIKKGSRVRGVTQANFSREYSVLHREGSELKLLDKQTEKVLHEQIDNVILIGNEN